MFGNPFKKQKPQGKKVVFAIEGMHCSSCSMNIDSELEEIEGVRSATTSYARAQTTVIVDPKVVRAEALADAIKTLGYNAKEVI